MDFQKLVSRFRQFGGMRLVWQYAKLGTLWPAVKAGVRCLVKGQSFKGIYPEVQIVIEPFLVEKYGSMVQDSRLRVHGVANDNENHNDNGASIPSINSGTEGSATIWWCWLQGLEQAPEIVKACYNSLVHGEWFKVHGYTVTVIDAKNWREYVELPGYIEVVS